MAIDRITPTRRPEGPPSGYHRWRTLLFLHWEVPVEVLRPLVPSRLTLDTFEGKAYVGLVPFTMEGIRPTRFLPALPGISAFHETNVRTYVHLEGDRPGVWFFSLDAANAPAVVGARVGWNLSYYLAKMSLEQKGDEVHYRTRRLYPPPTPAELEVSYTIGPSIGAAEPGTLEHFLAERYYLYAAETDGSLYRGQVHHPAYPLHHATVHSLAQTMLDASGIPVSGAPASVLFSPGVDVEVFSLVKV